MSFKLCFFMNGLGGLSGLVLRGVWKPLAQHGPPETPCSRQEPLQSRRSEDGTAIAGLIPKEHDWPDLTDTHGKIKDSFVGSLLVPPQTPRSPPKRDKGTAIVMQSGTHRERERLRIYRCRFSLFKDVSFFQRFCGLEDFVEGHGVQGAACNLTPNPIPQTPDPEPKTPKPYTLNP